MHSNLIKDYNYNFVEGIYFLYKKQLSKASQSFLKALNESKSSDLMYDKYLSYFGLVEALRKSKGGLIHSYEAVGSIEDSEFTMETLLNLAIVEYCSGFRWRCVKTIETGLKLMPRNELFLMFYDLIGKRNTYRKQIISLKRGNTLKKYLGRLHKRRKPATDDELFELIQKIIYTEYHDLKPNKL